MDPGSRNNFNGTHRLSANVFIPELMDRPINYPHTNLIHRLPIRCRENQTASVTLHLSVPRRLSSSSGAAHAAFNPCHRRAGTKI